MNELLDAVEQECKLADVQAKKVSQIEEAQSINDLIREAEQELPAKVSEAHFAGTGQTQDLNETGREMNDTKEPCSMAQTDHNMDSL